MDGSGGRRAADSNGDVRAEGAQTLLHGLHALEEIARGARTQREVQDRLGLAKSTVHRLVNTLRVGNYVRDSEHGLVLGPALIELGFSAIAENPLVEVAQPALRKLAQQVRDTVHLAVEDGEKVLYLAKLPGQRGAEMRSRVGQRMPMTRTGIGKALLLDSPDRWRRLYAGEAPISTHTQSLTADQFVERMGDFQSLGFALDVEENEPGIRCVAAPVVDPQGQIVGAVSVSATNPYMPADRMRELVPTVEDAADAISRAIGYTPTPEARSSRPGERARLDRVFRFE